MKASPQHTSDPYVEQLVKQICATIGTGFPEATLRLARIPPSVQLLLTRMAPRTMTSPSWI